MATDKEVLEPEQTVRTQTRQNGEVKRKAALWDIRGPAEEPAWQWETSACVVCFLAYHSLGQSPAVLISDPDQCKSLVLVFLKPLEVLWKPLLSCKGGHGLSTWGLCSLEDCLPSRALYSPSP